MNRRISAMVAGVVLLAAMCAAAQTPGKTSIWRGYEKTDFVVDGRNAFVVAPHRVAPGRPWVWRARFFDHRPEVDLTLLDLGFHIAYIDCVEMLGSPTCVRHWDAFYKYLTEERGFAKRPALEGMSRGGLYIYNWAAANPQKVACVYADGAVCDFKSWPGGKGKAKGTPGVWADVMKHYGFKTEEEAMKFAGNPVDNLRPLAEAKVPLLHVVGDADDLVPYEENTGLIKQRYEALGGSIQVIHKPGIGHEHGLADPTPIVRFIVSSVLEANPGAQTAPLLHGVKRIVILGDSITYGGGWVEYLEAFLRTRYPDRAFDIIDLGLPSETTSGLSEEGHAGGKFPRPCVHDRLDRILEKSKPDLVVACYGINDGIYLPLDEARFAAYRNGITKLVEKVRGAGAKILLMTPPPFDPMPVKKLTKDGVGGPFDAYDGVLEKYSQWLLEQRAKGWDVADVHGAINEFVKKRRAEEPGFFLAGDGVHTNALGHWLMNQQVLENWGVAAEVDGVAIDVGMLRTARGSVTDLKKDDKGVSFVWKTKLPMPLDGKWDEKSVKDGRIVERWDGWRMSVSGLPGEKYEVYEGQTLLATVSRQDLQKGIDLLSWPKFTPNQRSVELMKLVQQRQRMLKDAWLTDVGHNRPGMKKGLAMEEANRMAEEMEGKIREAAGAVEVRMRVEKKEGATDARG